MDEAAAVETTDIRELAAAARDRIGIKPALAAPKIEAMLRALPAHDRRSYCRDLVACDSDTGVWSTFAESLLVHETYFFRHPDQLRLLADVLLPRVLRDRLAAGRREIRVWCAGCSSGEEVYTLALLLQGAIAASPLPRLRDWDATVLGTDVSTPTIERARQGSYARAGGLNSFRDVPPFARHHFASIFEGATPTWAASAELRRMTRFQRHNLVTEPPPLGDVDLVVCRNTLIYFDETMSRAALASLEAALRPAGALLLGPAETTGEPSRLAMVCTDHAVFWEKRRTP